MHHRDAIAYSGPTLALHHGAVAGRAEETTRSTTRAISNKHPYMRCPSQAPSQLGAFLFAPPLRQDRAFIAQSTLMEWIFVSLASALAGFVDAIVGGGGLILVPAMFAAFPSAAPATLFGTNKGAAVWGTAMSAWQYSRRIQITWAIILPGIAAAAIGAFSGAWAVTLVNPDFLRKLLPFILLGVLLYTLAKKEMGREHTPRHAQRTTQWLTAGIGLVIGFYDGFFGPGTGSFFVFLLVRLLGYDFLNASINAKLMNVATNLAAIVLFALKGHVWWHFVLPLAVANVLGSVLGTWMALRHGAGFVRVIFIAVVSLLILKTGWDAFAS